jgi:hypothetical protein
MCPTLGFNNTLCVQQTMLLLLAILMFHPW